VAVRHGGRLQRPGQRQFGVDERGKGRLIFPLRQKIVFGPPMKHEWNTDAEISD
jgi:hypothetical protein